MTAEFPPSTVQTEQLTVELVAAGDSLVAGTRQWLALRFTHAPHWHTYWINPGDSGLPTRTRWTLPAGSSIGMLEWPAPARHALGDLINFGYEGALYLPIALQLEAGVPVSTQQLEVDVSWLVCREECIPGKARLGLALPVLAAGASADDGPHAAAIRNTVAELPVAQPWPMQVTAGAEQVQLHIADGGRLDPDSLEIYPVQPQVLGTAAPQVRRVGDSLHIDAARSDYFTVLPENFSVLLVQRDSRQAHLVRSTP